MPKLPVVVRESLEDQAPEPGHMLKAALELYDLGMTPIPISVGATRTLVRWSPYQDERPPRTRVEGWWRNGEHNIFVLTGRATRSVCIDCDSDAGHEYWEERLGKELLDSTALAKSRKGHHHWFRIPEGWTNYVASHNQPPDDPVRWDFLADRHGVMAPPSIHRSGEVRYEWVRPLTTAVEAPAELLDGTHIPKKEHQPVETLPNGTIKPGTGGKRNITDGPRWAKSALVNSAARLAQTTEGRNQLLNNLSFELHQAALAGWIDPEDVDDALEGACQDNGLTNDDGLNSVQATIRSGKEAAQLEGPMVATGVAATPPPAVIQQPGAWEPADVADFFENPPEPLERVGRGQMLYRETLHWLSGDPDSGKSVLAYAWAVDFMKNGENVVLLDEEAGLRSVGDKLRALGATTDMVRKHLTYLPPGGRDLVASISKLQKLVAAKDPQLVILDSAAPHIMATRGGEGEENSAKDVVRFINVALLPLANEGRTIVVIDHMTKASEGKGRSARGSGSKLGGTQVAYTLECQDPFSKHKAGKVTITCEKDRNGEIGRNTKFITDVTPQGQSPSGLLEIWPHQLTEEEIARGQAALAEKREARTNKGKIRQFLADNQTTTGWSPAEIGEKLGMSRNHVSSELQKLADDGAVDYHQSGQTRRWYSAQ